MHIVSNIGSLLLTQMRIFSRFTKEIHRVTGLPEKYFYWNKECTVSLTNHSAGNRTLVFRASFSVVHESMQIAR